MNEKTELILEQMVQLNDEELDFLVYDRACDIEFEAFNETWQATESHELLQQLFAVFVLQFEVENGGFDQFFRNSLLDLVEPLRRGLKHMEAPQHAALLEEALLVYKQGGTVYKERRNPSLDALDEEFFALPKLGKYRVNLIRQNLLLLTGS